MTQSWAHRRAWLVIAVLAVYLCAQLGHLSRHITIPSARAAQPQIGLHFEKASPAADDQDDCLLCLLMRGLDLAEPGPQAPQPLLSAEAVPEARFIPVSWSPVSVQTQLVRGPPVSLFS